MKTQVGVPRKITRVKYGKLIDIDELIKQHFKSSNTMWDLDRDLELLKKVQKKRDKK